MTYLQLINKILVRLRETQVASPTDTEYSQLVGAMVNDAKRVVEAAWDWSSLRTTISVSATVSDNSYTLTGSGQDYKLLDAYNVTQKSRLSLIPQQAMTTLTVLNTAATGAPDRFSLNGTDSSGDQNILVYPTPDASYTLTFDVIVREAELSSSTDITLLPAYPLELLAWAMAVRERGESGGTSASELFALADRALGDAVALDASRYQAELTWRAV